MLRTCRGAFVAMVVVAGSGCAVLSGPVDFSTVESGWHTGYDDDGFVVRVVESREEWGAFWQAHRRSTSEPGPPPPVDFGERFVVALFLGERRSSGYGLNVSDVRVEDGGYVVGYATQAPGQGCPVLTVITWPYVIVSVERRTGADVDVEVELVHERIVEC